MEHVDHSSESDLEFEGRIAGSNQGFIARLLRPEARPHRIRLAGLALLALGVVVGQFWPPAFGLGAMAYGGGGLVFNAIALRGPFGRLLEQRAGRIIGFVVTCFGAWAFVTDFCPSVHWKRAPPNKRLQLAARPPGAWRGPQALGRPGRGGHRRPACG
jgi:hypothetical protein